MVEQFIRGWRVGNTAKQFEDHGRTRGGFMAFDDGSHAGLDTGEWTAPDRVEPDGGIDEMEHERQRGPAERRVRLLARPHEIVMRQIEPDTPEFSDKIVMFDLLDDPQEPAFQHLALAPCVRHGHGLLHQAVINVRSNFHLNLPGMAPGTIPQYGTVTPGRVLRPPGTEWRCSGAQPRGRVLPAFIYEGVSQHQHVHAEAPCATSRLLTGRGTHPHPRRGVRPRADRRPAGTFYSVD